MLCHLDTLKVAQCSRAKVEHDKIEQTQDILDFHKLDWWAAQLSDAWCRSTRCPVCEGTLPLTAGTRLPNIWEPCWRKKVSALSRARWSRQEHPYRYIIFLRDVFWKAFGWHSEWHNFSLMCKRKQLWKETRKVWIGSCLNWFDRKTRTRSKRRLVMCFPSACSGTRQSLVLICNGSWSEWSTTYHISWRREPLWMPWCIQFCASSFSLRFQLQGTEGRWSKLRATC